MDTTDKLSVLLPELVKGIVNAVHDCFALIDQNYKILWINKALEQKGFILKDIQGEDFFRAFENLETIPQDHPTFLAMQTNETQESIRKGSDGSSYLIISIPIQTQEGTYILEMSREIKASENHEAQKAKQETSAIRDSKKSDRNLPFEKVSEHTFDSVLITDLKYNVIYANSSFEQLTGYDRQSMLGQPPLIFKRSMKNVGVDKEFWKTILNGRIWEQNSERTNASGAQYFTEMKVVPLSDNLGTIHHYLVIEKDITTERSMHDDLEKYQLIAQSNPDPMIQVDHEGKILFANNAANQLFFKEKILDHMQEIFGKEGDFLIAQLKDTSKVERIQHYSNLTGNQYQISAVDIPSAGAINLYFSDVSSFKKTERFLLEKKMELERFYKIATGRELKMIELKQRIKELEKKLEEANANTN